MLLLCPPQPQSASSPVVPSHAVLPINPHRPYPLPKVYEGLPGFDPDERTADHEAPAQSSQQQVSDDAASGVVKKGDDECLTMEEVAGAWMESISKIDSASAKAMCVPAVAIAAGGSYDTPACPKAFDSTAEGGEKSRGIWQIGLMYYSPDRKKQAQAVYQFYTSDNPDYGCLSDWCKQTACGVAHDGIGQDDKVIGHHRFCKGAWPASSGQYAARLLAVGGKVAVAAACANAAKLGSLKNTSVPFKEWDAAQAPAATTTVAEAAAKSVSVHRSVTCENEHEDWECDAWQSTGECEATPEYMHKTCALSCKSCG